MTIPPSDLVLIDTCVRVGFFNRNQSAERITVDPLLDDDRAAITGVILAEILQGFRRDEQADWVASSLKGLHDLEPTWDDWRVKTRPRIEPRPDSHGSIGLVERQLHVFLSTNLFLYGSALTL